MDVNMDDEEEEPYNIPVIPFFIHLDDTTFDSVWPIGYPIPRWGEGFHFQNEEYIIEDSAWHLEETPHPSGNPEIARVAPSYHIYIKDADLVDDNDLLPSRFK
jgi:hypothetical protein